MPRRHDTGGLANVGSDASDSPNTDYWNILDTSGGATARDAGIGGSAALGLDPSKGSIWSQLPKIDNATADASAEAGGATPDSAAPQDPWTWSGQAYSGGGLTGSPTQFGNNFIGMQGYLNANRTPGLSNASYQTYANGPSADYSKNMNALDQSIYNYYGVKGTGASTPAASTPVAPSSTADTTTVQPHATPQNTNFDTMQQQMGQNVYNRRRVL